MSAMTKSCLPDGRQGLPDGRQGLTLAAPFPYFGGKTRVAKEVWARFGQVRNYCESFFGSGAVLLARPQPFEGTETVNDIDGYLCCFWRAIQKEPGAVADLMNWPVNEVDLEARHRWLVETVRKREHLERMRHDPDYYDVKVAAWWCWGLCAWIGSGWCGGEYFGLDDERNRGRGTCNDAAKRPHLHGSRGVHRQLPHLGNAGRGVHRQLPHLGGAGMGECARRGEVLRQWMQALADRLRNVRVCCGDWSRICTPTPTVCQGLTAVFMDPPYSIAAGRDDDIYRCEDGSVAHAVREWCLAHGDDPMFRIALCGYEGEHEMPGSWECLAWKAHGGYGLIHKTRDQYVNKYRERIWFSRHCIAQRRAGQKGLFT